MRTHTKKVAVAHPSPHAYAHLDEAVEINFPGVGRARMEIKIRLDHVWVSGWVNATSSDLGLKVGKLVAERLGLEHVGLNGYTGGKADFCNAPFECDIQRRWMNRRGWGWMETIEDTHKRVMTALRRRLVVTQT